MRLKDKFLRWMYKGLYKGERPLHNNKRIKVFAKADLSQEEVDNAFLSLKNGSTVKDLRSRLQLFIDELKKNNNPLPSKDSLEEAIKAKNAHLIKWHIATLDVMVENGYSVPRNEQVYCDYFLEIQVGSTRVYDKTLKMLEDYSIPIPEGIDWLKPWKDFKEKGEYLHGPGKSREIHPLMNYLEMLRKHGLGA